MPFLQRLNSRLAKLDEAVLGEPLRRPPLTRGRLLLSMVSPAGRRNGPWFTAAVCSMIGGILLLGRFWSIRAADIFVPCWLPVIGVALLMDRRRERRRQ